MKTTRRKFEHVFTSTVPDVLEADKLYVSLKYNTAVHKCACGCGEEVVTPISPSDWKITYNGETLSLHPSIGNWSYPCRSHYWIQGDQIVWAEAWSDELIMRSRETSKKTASKGKEANKKGLFYRIKSIFK
jgi:hypothetical protein